MKLTLRSRIFLTLASLFGIFAVLGGSGVILLSRLGGSIDVILRENYDSVLYMERLNEALERIDSSFQFALVGGRENKAGQDYAANWKRFRENIDLEEKNITLPGERELVDRLKALRDRYQEMGDAFFAREAGAAQRHDDYFGAGGLFDIFKEIKQVAGSILHINQENMEGASRLARQTAQESRLGFLIGCAAASLVGGLVGLRTVRAILQPIRDVTRSAQAIGAGNLDQVVPVLSQDELGQLADAFNGMARQLRQYRQSDYARLLRAQQTSQATIDSFPDPVLVVNSEGQVEMANPSASRVLGVTAASNGRAPLPWQPPDPLQAALDRAIKEQQSYLPESFEQAIPFGKDGAERSYLPRLLPIRDPGGNTLGAALLLQDVTRFRLLDQVKSDLVATVSHELKTPLTSIRLAHHLLLEETIGSLSSKQTELLLDARDNTERLLAMVNNLLDLARLEQGRQRLDRHPGVPADLLQEAAEAIAPRAAAKGVAVTVEAPADLPPIQVDRQRFGYALGNLLDNALNHTPRGGRIALAAERIGSGVLLRIEDTGEGIPAEHLPHIFDKFFRVPGREERAGTGLGLAIVREIVQAHQGDIDCRSEAGKGTKFSIRLPL